MIKVFEPFTPYEKIKPNYEPVKKLLQGKAKPGLEKPEDIERSLRRTKNKVRDYVLCNHFDWFVSFTFDTNRYDINASKDKMSRWLKNQQKRNKNLSYLIVSEYHKDGKAIHFHAVIKNYKGKYIRANNPKTNKPLIQKGRQVYNFTSFRSGFTNAQKIDNSPESRLKIAGYISKYITKDMMVLFGKNRYRRSQDLKLPASEENPSDWYKRIPADKLYASENGLTYVFLTHTHKSNTLSHVDEDSPKLALNDKGA
jgi:hypothetical protein